MLNSHYCSNHYLSIILYDYEITIICLIKYLWLIKNVLSKIACEYHGWFKLNKLHFVITSPTGKL